LPPIYSGHDRCINLFAIITSYQFRGEKSNINIIDVDGREKFEFIASDAVDVEEENEE
jgi:hypothetical protein